MNVKSVLSGHSRTTGKGNCLFNACSIALIGDESLSHCLRCLTSIELFLFPEFYNSHPLIEVLSKKAKFANENNAFMILLSYDAADCYVKGDRFSSVQGEAIHISQNFKFASMLCMFALSSAIKTTIESYYPITDGNENDRYEAIFNCTITPRLISNARNEKIHIFRCASVPITFLLSGKLPNNKNHYVPLLEIETFMNSCISTEVEAHSNESKQLDYRKRKQDVSFTSSKNRQGTLDNVIVKKPKLATEENSSTSHEIKDPSPSSSSVASKTETCSVPDRENTNEPMHIDKNDLSLFFKEAYRFSDTRKYDLLCNIWKPDRFFAFPKNASGRRFQYSWFSSFPWLVYSKFLDGAFCLYCVLFGGESTHNASKLNNLFRAPLNDWKSALRNLNSHCSRSLIHSTATLRATQFRSCMENKVQGIDVQLDNAVAKQIELNRQKLVPIVGAVILCGRQNVSLRAHRDDSKHLGEGKSNPGNFIAILNYLYSCGENENFRDHYDNAPKSATYKSKTTQNEIINICGAMITEKIVSEIKDAKFFSILADEATDVSNKEQMALVLRYVDQGFLLKEAFLGFVHCSEGLKGSQIATTIIEAIEKLGLDPKFCRGQGYDGAGNMAGKCNGAAATIRKKYPHAIYVHCRSHVLNLAVASACQLTYVRNMMGLVKSVSDFFNVHPKRFSILEAKIQDLVPGARHSHLIDVCRTRWIARIDGLDVFVELFEAIVSALGSVSLNEDRSWSSESVREASTRMANQLSQPGVIM